MKLSIIVPAHNEEENISDAVNRIESSIPLPFELVIVNDHSADKTQELINNLARQYQNISSVENKRDKGFANAVKAGFESASGDALVLVMADLCDDLPTITKMFKILDDGYDVVCGCRYIKGGGRLGGSRLKGMLSSFAGWSLYYFLGVPTHDIANAFKMYRKEVIKNIDIKAEGFEISMEIPLKAYYSGFKITEVPTIWRERTKGKSSFRILKLLPNYLKLYIWAIYRRLRG
ncbi:MAG: glycosyltransferase [Candidatus Omnitrophica bacterium]|jgi:glycosyltransferase involved in cell wall biosynthesis|nr:glycosyltransferase [Candidatus Omnitrophota bacterium]